MSTNTSKYGDRMSAAHAESPAPVAQLATLEKAYLSAAYCLEIEGSSRVLYIDQPAEDVTTWMAERDMQRLVLFTACNPGSRPSTEGENIQRQRRLEQTVAEHGLRAWPARNRDPRGQWPDEPGLAIADLPDDLLARWLEAFGQNAAVLLEPPARPRLVWHPGLGR
ncbi:DUF3293 domain-containing protein [Thioalkalivibrio sp. ALMg9]|uniref:DUF3293 domain-containing protein n=1 Tax=Thioalkalivibrio sp. ALMg9 TaxID=1266912 RepID=UPI0003624A36|nr:DUF3293 domain-containing protein [Thioalkalivibrio sp. ALMg9]